MPDLLHPLSRSAAIKQHKTKTAEASRG